MTKGASAAQNAIGWVLARGDDIVPLMGARSRDRLIEALGALDITLGARLTLPTSNALPPAAGERYPVPPLIGCHFPVAREYSVL